MYEHVTLGEVILTVTNVNESVSFYKDIIGFKHIELSEKEAKMFSNEGKLLLTLRENREAKKNPGQLYVGLYHIALLYPDRASLGTQIKHLLAHNIEMGGADHIVSEAVYIHDPDGNGIELYRDRPRTNWSYEENGMIVMDTKPLDVTGLLAVAGEWNGMPNGLTMGHIHTHVKNLADIEAFYKDILQFDVMTYFGQQALFMSGAGYHHHFGFNTWVRNKEKPKEAFVGMEQYTIHVNNEESFNKVRNRANKNIVDQGEAWFIVQDPSEMYIKFKSHS
ncbi:glyoxalase [Bacillus sp. C1-1]|nr:glyoxalase [Bacillus sp. C1-1]